MVTVRSYQQAFYLEKTQKLTASAALQRANGCAPTLSLGSGARLRAPGAVGDGSGATRWLALRVRYLEIPKQIPWGSMGRRGLFNIAWHREGYTVDVSAGLVV